MADPVDINSSSDQGSSALVAVGQNLVVGVNGIINAINNKFPDWVTAPANSTASGVAGEVAYSGSSTTTAYLFVCLVSGNAGVAQWGRTQLTTGF